MMINTERSEMSFLPCFLCSCITILLIMSSPLGLAAYQVITVDKSGHGNFSSIQSAINYVPSYNKYWLCINVKAGIYREKINIPYDKTYIYLKGDGKRKTIVVWDDHDSTAESATFTSLADDIVVKSMSFVNSYNSPGGANKNPRVPAVAAMIAGDRTAFYRCTFSGLQDTLWDNQGRHYFHGCTIQGAVDFIFGSGQSIYDGCAIQVLGGALEGGVAGFITAQGRTSPNEPNGFVFKNCVVFGTGAAFLGRPWREYARVLFYKSQLTGIVMPEGWDAWNLAGRENQLTFGEYGCFGPGSDTAQRVSWEKKLQWNVVQELTSLNFINKGGWIERQPN